MKTKNEMPYPIQVNWSAVDEAYEARVPALKHCIAYGSTPEKAVKEVRVAAELWLEAATATGKPVPQIGTTLHRIHELSPLLNVSAVAKAADISVQTLSSKLKRGTALTADEEQRIGGVLAAHGLRS